MEHADVLRALGFAERDLTGGGLTVVSPIDGATVAAIAETPLADMAGVIARSKAAFKSWRTLPAPRRGELVRLLGEELRAAKEDLGALVTLEAGKITSEG
ncbi:MAG: aldehyde dehydrogenase family protein, partial [Pseudomonadota bacterium]